MIPDKMEMRARYISRFEGARISPVLLLSVLEKRGWWRGAVTADGFVKFHVKHFAGAGVTAVAEYPGIIAGSPHHCDDQNLLGSYFLQGHRKPDDSFTVSEALGLKNVDPVALSEVLCDLSALTGG